MKNHACTLLLVIALTACAGGNYKYPTASSNPKAMSANTLCYRHAARPNDETLIDEVALRGLSCDSILRNDPLYRDQSYDGGRY